MIGRAEGADIVQHGTTEDGRHICWRFLEIEACSFLWRGETSSDQGTSWCVVTEFRAVRAKPA
jgi:hypothetical protein